MEERMFVAYIARDDISAPYVSHLEIAVVFEERPNNSDLVYFAESTAARERILATLIAKTTTLAYVSGMSKRDQAGNGLKERRSEVLSWWKVRRSLNTSRSFSNRVPFSRTPVIESTSCYSRCVTSFETQVYFRPLNPTKIAESQKKKSMAVKSKIKRNSLKGIKVYKSHWAQLKGIFGMSSSFVSFLNLRKKVILIIFTSSSSIYLEIWLSVSLLFYIYSLYIYLSIYFNLFPGRELQYSIAIGINGLRVWNANMLKQTFLGNYTLQRYIFFHTEKVGACSAKMARFSLELNGTSRDCPFHHFRLRYS